MGKCAAISIQEVRATVAELMQSKRPMRDACLFSIQVSQGLRVSEALSLRIADVIDSSNCIRRETIIEKRHCKGQRNQHAILWSDHDRIVLYDAIKEAAGLNLSRPSDFLFSATGRRGAISRRRAHSIIYSALRRAGITHTGGTHTGRKTFAALFLAQVDADYKAGLTSIYPLVALQQMLGHRELKTTQRYLDTGIQEARLIAQRGVMPW